MTLKEISNDVNEHYKKKLPFIIFSKPKSNTVDFYFQSDSTLYDNLKKFKDNIFVFSPFDNKKNKTIYTPLNKCISHKIDYKPFEKSINRININSENLLEKNKFINLVDKSIKLLDKGILNKVVLSRVETINKPRIIFNELLKNLFLSTNNSFRYIWYHPKIGFWIGSTPEKLLSIKNNMIETVALAGTKKIVNGISSIWSNKEIEEQKYVKDYILKSLSKNVNNISYKDTDNVKSGELLHLNTLISGNLKSFSDYKNVIQALHPTPAVCGIPLNESKQFIDNNEYYNRKYYTGYLGVINEQKQYLSLFVNLRCAELTQSKINIFVGAGITRDSNSNNEFQETFHKTQIIKKVFF